MAAQLIASHTAAMECYRRAMIGEQSFEGRRENLSQANKLSSGHRLGFTGGLRSAARPRPASVSCALWLLSISSHSCATAKAIAATSAERC